MSDKKIMKQGDGAALSATDEIEARLARLRLAAVENEERVIRYGCASTNGTYLVRFRRKAAGERFSIVAVEKIAPPGSGANLFGGLFKKAAPEAQTYSWDDFDTDDLLCPYCGSDDGSTRCRSCDREMCGSGRRTMPGGKRKFFCHESCGASFYTEPARSVSARKGGCGDERPQINDSKSAGALSPPHLRITGPRK